LPKAELFTLFNQEGSVDPPPTPPPSGADLTEILNHLASLDVNLTQLDQLVLENKVTVQQIRAVVERLQQQG
jgi:hypothetical protein